MVDGFETACWSCNSPFSLNLNTQVSRQDACPKCARDIKVCKNCQFYDPGAQWECRETISDRVSDKEKANFCDSFKLAKRGGAANRQSPSAADLKAKAEALFKK